MKKELEVKSQEANLTVLSASDANLWGNDQIGSNDIIIPRILVMQGLSEFVTSGKAKFGDFVNSLSEKVVGSIASPMEFIPFYIDKVQKVSKEVNGKYVIDHFEPLTPINEKYPWEDFKDGKKIKRENSYNVYAVLPGYELPVMLTFKSTSIKTGKEIATQMYAINMQTRKIAPCSSVMILSGEKKQNDKGVFTVTHAKVANDATKEQIAECARWIQIVKSGNAQAAPEEDEIPSGLHQASNTEF